MHLPTGNPSFRMPPGGLGPLHARLRSTPPAAPLRPLIVLGGWRTPAIAARALARNLRRLTGHAESQVVAIGFMDVPDIDAAVGKATRLVRTRLRVPPGEDLPTLDVVGISMGGLVARAAVAADRASNGHAPRIAPWPIARLFTLGTPHRGARLARWIRPDRAATQMRPGSDWLRTLDAAAPRAPFELVCYAYPPDMMVGATRSAPAGHTPIWKRGWPIVGHHIMFLDDLVTTDIALRLRGEQPLARVDAPPPRD